MMHLAKMMREKYGIPFIRVSYFGIDDMARALYAVADFFAQRDLSIQKKAQELVREELEKVMPAIREYRAALEGKKAAVYVGGAFKAVSLMKALRLLGMTTAIAGSQTGNKEDYEEIKAAGDAGMIIVDDANPLELAAFVKEKGVDLFIGGVKERPIAYKLGVGFCDHNHERKTSLAGFEGMVNFAREVYETVMSPVWQFVPGRDHL